jgi:hypothetical protein
MTLLLLIRKAQQFDSVNQNIQHYEPTLLFYDLSETLAGSRELIPFPTLRGPDIVATATISAKWLRPGKSGQSGGSRANLGFVLGDVPELGLRPAAVSQNWASRGFVLQRRLRAGPTLISPSGGRLSIGPASRTARPAFGP